MTRKVEVKMVAQHNNHGLKANGNVDVSLKARYDEITNAMQLLQMLNNDIIVSVKVAGGKPVKLGMFRLNGLNFNHDGESTIKLNSTNDFVEVDNLNVMVTSEPFNVRFVAKVEMEDDEDEE